MKKLILLLILFSAVPLYAFDDPDVIPVDSKISASLADCRNFSVNFKSVSENDDKNTFQDRFGYPRDVNYSSDINDGSTTEYNYDTFTKVTLSCRSNTCRAVCSSKY